MKNIIISAIIGLSLTGCGVVSSTQGGAVGADRKQVMLVSSAQMKQGAEQQYAKVLQQAHQARALNTDKKQTRRVRAIAKRLISQVGVFRRDALAWRWEVNVINKNELNAWCMPGGKIAVYSGIINKLKLTDAEIASVMGHEISHALKEHSRERASQNMAKKLGFMAAGELLGVSSQNLQLANMVSKYALELPFSRSHETEADNMGIELMARAGYDPRAAVNVWKKMQRASKGAPAEFMSTHPSHSTRISNLQHMSQKVYPLYLNAKKSHSNKRQTKRRRK